MLRILNYAESRKFQLPTPVSEVENQKWKAGRPRSLLGFLINGLVLFLQLEIQHRWPKLTLRGKGVCNVIYITYVTRAGVALQTTVENIRDFVWEIYH